MNHIMNFVSFDISFCQNMCIFGINARCTCIQRQPKKHVPKITSDSDSEKSTFLKKFFSCTRGYFMMRYLHLHMYLHVDQMSNSKVITNHPKVISKVALTLLSSTYVVILGKWLFQTMKWLTSKNNITLYFFASHIKRNTFLKSAVKTIFVWSLEIRL